MSTSQLTNLTFITGGARSGKSSFAETLASSKYTRVVYIATMEELHSDSEASSRIRHHRERRPSSWSTVERALDVHESILSLNDRGASQPSVCILDCLSMYVSNIVLEYYEEKIAFEIIEQKVKSATKLLIEAIAAKGDYHFIVVTNEVGWGIVPENGLARIYRDALGFANQMFAQAAGEVWLSCVGLQIRLKPQ